MTTPKPVIPNSPPEQHQSLRKDVVTAFESVAGVIKAATAPLPTQTGDGSAVVSEKASGFLKDIVHLHPRDVITVLQLAKDAATGNPINDKTFLMERLIQLTSELPLNSKIGTILNEKFMQQLYDDLQHPPTAFLGDAHKYRAADGSFNVSYIGFQRLLATGLSLSRYYAASIFHSLYNLLPIFCPYEPTSGQTNMMLMTGRTSWLQRSGLQTRPMLEVYVHRSCALCILQMPRIYSTISWLETLSRLIQPGFRA